MREVMNLGLHKDTNNSEKDDQFKEIPDLKTYHIKWGWLGMISGSIFGAVGLLGIGLGRTISNTAAMNWKVMREVMNLGLHKDTNNSEKDDQFKEIPDLKTYHIKWGWLGMIS